MADKPGKLCTIQGIVESIETNTLKDDLGKYREITIMTLRTDNRTIHCICPGNISIHKGTSQIMTGRLYVDDASRPDESLFMDVITIGTDDNMTAPRPPDTTPQLRKFIAAWNITGLAIPLLLRLFTIMDITPSISNFESLFDQDVIQKTLQTYKDDVIKSQHDAWRDERKATKTLQYLLDNIKPVKAAAAPDVKRPVSIIRHTPARGMTPAEIIHATQSIEAPQPDIIPAPLDITPPPKHETSQAAAAMQYDNNTTDIIPTEYKKVQRLDTKLSSVYGANNEIPPAAETKNNTQDNNSSTEQWKDITQPPPPDMYNTLSTSQLMIKQDVMIESIVYREKHSKDPEFISKDELETAILDDGNNGHNKKGLLYRYQELIQDHTWQPFLKSTPDAPPPQEHDQLLLRLQILRFKQLEQDYFKIGIPGG